MKEIALTRGLKAMVDDEDYERMASRKWYAAISARNGFVYTYYAARMATSDEPRYKKILLMHREILGLTDRSIFADHVNRNGLDNRRSNLRTCSPRQNQGNRRLERDNTSGFRGISFDCKKWRSVINIGGHRIPLGTFDSPEEAARAYDKAAIEHFGEFAYLNFPASVEQEGK